MKIYANGFERWLTVHIYQVTTNKRTVLSVFLSPSLSLSLSYTHMLPHTHALARTRTHTHFFPFSACLPSKPNGSSPARGTLKIFLPIEAYFRTCSSACARTGTDGNRWRPGWRPRERLQRPLAQRPADRKSKSDRTGGWFRETAGRARGVYGRRSEKPGNCIGLESGRIFQHLFPSPASSSSCSCCSPSQLIRFGSSVNIATTCLSEW